MVDYFANENTTDGATAANGAAVNGGQPAATNGDQDTGMEEISVSCGADVFD